MYDVKKCEVLRNVCSLTTPSITKFMWCRWRIRKCSIGEMVLEGKLERSNRRKTCPIAILSTKNTIRTGLEPNPDLSCATPTTNNLLTHGKAPHPLEYTHTIGTMPGLYVHMLYRGADKSLARPTSRYILFDAENISFDASLVIYI
jgi:hypothetical protein